ncbi:MAG: hypothetical protein HOP19_13205, partial [Acidobacteria bacterium]|nr:hypothetical protein [Acidobacteriota bacterium]
MKLLLPVIWAAVFCFSALAQSKTDKDLEDLRGAVHAVRTMVSYELKEAGKTVKKGRQSDDFHTYDREGNLIEKKETIGPIRSQSFFSNGINGERIEKRYPILRDSKGRLPRGVVPGGGGNGEREEEFMILNTTYQFNADQQQLEAITRWRNSKGGQLDTYRFDAQGRVIEFTRRNSFNAAAETLYRFEYKLDEKGVVTELISYAPDGKISQRTIYRDIVLDKHGNWIRRT